MMKAKTTPRWFLLIFVSFACVDYSRAVLLTGDNITLSARQRTSVQYGTADKAVDGDTTGNFFSKSCMHTEEISYPWWAVDLGSIYTVLTVIIYNRVDCCPFRLRDLRIGLRNTWPSESESNPIAFNHLCALISGEQAQSSVNITCYAGATGRYLVIQIDGSKNILTMCEVEAWGTLSDIDECASSPCQNGATCTDGIKGADGYTCSCSAGYTDSSCQTDIDECSSSPCQNGATCTDDVYGYNCSCSLGYTDSSCETDIDECASSPCQNGATCTDSINGYNCFCSVGHTGSSCQTDIDECQSSPCQNGATCRDGVNGYTCSCVAGVVGSQCETDIDECQSSPCQNGATCRDGVNGYTCSCVAGVVGSQCETVLFTQSGRFTIVNKDYRETLADKTSDDYKTLNEQIKTEVRLVYTGTNYHKHIVAVRDITFSKGSVVVEYKLDLNMAITSESLRQQLKKYVDDHAGYAHQLMINSSSISFEDAVSSGVVPTNWATDLPEWSIVAFLTLFGVVLLVVVVLVPVIWKCLPKRPSEIRRTEDGRREDAAGYSDVGERRWIGAGNMWRKDDSWLHAQNRNRETMREETGMALYNPGYDTRGGSFDDWRLRGNRFSQDSRYVRRYY